MGLVLSLFRVLFHFLLLELELQVGAPQLLLSGRGNLRGQVADELLGANVLRVQLQHVCPRAGGSSGPVSDVVRHTSPVTALRRPVVHVSAPETPAFPASGLPLISVPAARGALQEDLLLEAVVAASARPSCRTRGRLPCGGPRCVARCHGAMLDTLSRSPVCATPLVSRVTSGACLDAAVRADAFGRRLPVPTALGDLGPGRSGRRSRCQCGGTSLTCPYASYDTVRAGAARSRRRSSSPVRSRLNHSSGTRRAGPSRALSSAKVGRPTDRPAGVRRRSSR